MHHARSLQHHRNLYITTSVGIRNARQDHLYAGSPLGRARKTPGTPVALRVCYAATHPASLYSCLGSSIHLRSGCRVSLQQASQRCAACVRSTWPHIECGRPKSIKLAPDRAPALTRAYRRTQPKKSLGSRHWPTGGTYGSGQPNLNEGPPLSTSPGYAKSRRAMQAVHPECHVGCCRGGWFVPLTWLAGSACCMQTHLRVKGHPF